MFEVADKFIDLDRNDNVMWYFYILIETVGNGNGNGKPGKK